MDNAGYAALQIIPSFDGFQGRLERGTSGSMSRAGQRGGRIFGDSAGRSIASTMSTHVKRAAFLAAGALSAAAVAGGALARASFEEAREAQKVGALTVSTLDATGHAANIGARGVERLAGSLSHKAAVDDEVIQAGLNMLLTFKNVRNEVGKGNDIFNQAGTVVTDMAAAMAAASGGDIDLKSASIQVGKALNDPIKGIGALSRVGVTFTQQQKDQIEALVASGDTLDAQKIILRELTSEFGGAAHSQATDADRVTVAWGNMEEKLGVALLPLMKDFNRFLLRDGIPAAEHWIDVFEDKGVPALRHFFEKAQPVAQDVLPQLAEVLGTTRDVLADAAPYARDLVEAFNDMPDWAKKALVAGGLTVWAGSKVPGAGSLAKGGSAGLLGLVSKAKPLPVFVVNNGVGGAGIPGLPSGGTTKLPGGGKVPPILGAGGGLLMALGFGAAAGGAANDHPWDGPPGRFGTGMSSDELKASIKDTAAKESAQQRDALSGLLHLSELGLKPKFKILGLIEEEAKIEKLRRRAASHAIEVPLVAKLDDVLAQFFGDAFGANGGLDKGGLLSGGHGRRGGVTVNVGKVMPHNYQDFMGQMQQRATAAQLDGVSR